MADGTVHQRPRTVSRPYGTCGGSLVILLSYLNLVYSSAETKSTRKQKIEHTQKPLTSFKMWVLCDKKEAQIPPIRAEKEREEK